jgi:Fe-S-cluster containining protein
MPRLDGRTAGPPGTGAQGRERIARGDRDLLRVLDGELAEVARRAGAWLACKPGCDACCHGPFPITRLDAWRLRRGLEQLQRREPGRAGRVARRAERAVAVLREGFPGDHARGRLGADEAELDRFFERHAGVACPALDRRTGRCDLYAWRPVSCRTFGPPLRVGDEDLPPCGLCFRGAEAGTIERCRIEPDGAGREHALLRAMGAVDRADWETLIAFALQGDRT